MAETDFAVGHLLWRFYAALPRASMAIAPAVHFAGGVGGLVFLSGLRFDASEIVLTVRVPCELVTKQLRAMLSVAEFVEVKRSHATTFEEWVWYTRES